MFWETGEQGLLRSSRVIQAPIRPQSFAEIIDDLKPDFPSEGPVGGAGIDASAQALNPDWLLNLFAETVDRAEDEMAGGGGSGFCAFAYEDVEDEGVSERPSISEEDRVAAELELETANTTGDLKRIRRAFALRNHPDLMRSALCAQATMRMKIANMLIDRRRKEIEARR